MRKVLSRSTKKSRKNRVLPCINTKRAHPTRSSKVRTPNYHRRL